MAAEVQHLDVESNQAMPSQDVRERKHIWFLQGAGLAGLMLMGVVALSHHGGDHDEKPSGHSLAFSPVIASGVRPAGASIGKRERPIVMDETLMEKALAGELEEEGKQNVFMSETGWAAYLDKEAGSSYSMNERPSKAQDGYYTADVFSNPLDVAGDWLKSVKRAAADPGEAAFMTVQNDQSGNRAFPKGTNEINSRTIKPKTKDMNPKLRITGIPGFNLFGSPSSKQGDFTTKEQAQKLQGLSSSKFFNLGGQEEIDSSKMNRQPAKKVESNWNNKDESGSFKFPWLKPE